MHFVNRVVSEFPFWPFQVSAYLRAMHSLPHMTQNSCTRCFLYKPTHWAGHATVLFPSAGIQQVSRKSCFITYAPPPLVQQLLTSSLFMMHPVCGVEMVECLLGMFK